MTELIVVIGILGILIGLLLPSLASVMPALYERACRSNLTQLHLRFLPLATEPEGWPQLPKGIRAGSVEEERFWIEYAKNELDVPEKIWHCPAIDKSIRRSPQVDHVPLIHYLPTLFDSRPGTPNKWPAMPWFSEIGNIHGKGNLVIRSDGSITPMAPVQ